MNTEEILLKLGLDGSSFARGIRTIKGQIQDFQQTGHSGFVHVGNEARAFHRTLHQISEASPIMGGALRLALSPVSGILLGITAAFKFLMETISEANKEMREMEKAFAEPLTNAKKAVTEANDVFAKLNR